jgi:hypothetical protein
MDVEKTMLFILESQRRSEENHRRIEESQRRAEGNHRRIEESQRRSEENQRRAERRADQFDKKLNSIAGMVKLGMKMVIEQRKSHKEMDVKLNALIDAQLAAEERMRNHEQWLRRHDEKFDRLLDALRRRNGNGHKN